MKRLLHLNLVALAVGIPVCACYGQGTFQFHITFDGPPFISSGSAISVTNYVESGMSFRPLGSTAEGGTFTRHGGGILTSPESGSAYLRAALTQSLMFSFLYAPTFNLISVDLAEYSTVLPDAVTVHFVGYRLDGSIVTTDFTTDGVIDGTGPLADFETFHFGPEFSNLTRVEIPTWGWSLDNLVFTVPEPSTGALVILGGILFRLARMSAKPPGLKRPASRR